MQKHALIIGSGVAGMKAALELAEYGYQVTVVEKQPSIGGKISQLDRQFPNNRCGLCQILPVSSRDACEEYCLRRDISHKNINVIVGAEVERVEGEAGKFKVDVLRRSRGVSEAKCIACDKCAEVCPVEVDDEFVGNLSKRKAIYVRYPLGYPDVYVIDFEKCTKCGKCAEICPTKAIDLQAKAETITLDAGVIILAPGFEGVDVDTLSAYRHGKYPDVLTSIEFERILSGYGPSGGELKHPSDGATPKKIAFLQCIGSRDFKRDYCSSACCMYALKEALVAMEKNPDLDITVYYMDIRCFGKGYHRYYEEAKQKGIKFTRCRVPVVEKSLEGNLAVSYVDENDESKKEYFDMIVLSTGQAAPANWEKLGRVFGIELNEWGFAKTRALNPVESTRDGIFVCGSFTWPKDIPDSIAEAGAAAAKTIELLGKPMRSEMQPEAKGDKLGLLICSCGGEISDAVKLKERYSREGIEKVEVVDYLCLDFENVRRIMGDSSRIVIAACAPYGIAGAVKRASGLPPENIEIADIRSSRSSAKKIVDLGIEKLKGIEKGRSKKVEAKIAQRALIIGGGIAGMQAALAIANTGYEVDLVEKNSELGGNLKKLKHTLEGDDIEGLLRSTVQAVENQKLIKVHNNSTVTELSGYPGAFTAKIGDDKTQCYGSIVLATGGGEYPAAEYPSDQRIITQRELEAKLSNNEIDKRVKNLVMLQCIGSRNDKNRYCSRVCCNAAIKNAIKLKESNPEVEVYILNKDIVTYGFAEHHYTIARKLGITFLKYDGEPSIELSGNNPSIKFIDSLLKEEIMLSPDMIVLSTGIVPGKDNQLLSSLLNIPLDQDGFFKEANTKFRPVDVTDGIFVAGLAHSPRNVKEAIAQGLAAAARAMILLARDRLPASQLIATVNKRWCAGCELCIEVCPYSARRMDAENKVATVIEYMCRGCGACAVACPSSASKLRRLSDDQVISMIDLALEEEV